MKERRKLILKKDFTGHSGSEADIYSVKDGCYKKFIHTVSQVNRRNKANKLHYLDKIEHLKKYYPHLYYIVLSFFNKKNIDGYVMEPIGGEFLNRSYLSFEEKMLILKLLDSILNDFNEEGIFYHDIRIPNIKICNNNLILLDIDSITTPEYPSIDAVPTELISYMHNGGVAGLGAQLAMFNYFTADLLNKELKNSKEYSIDNEGKEILSDLGRPEPDTFLDHEYLYQHIKRLK